MAMKRPLAVAVSTSPMRSAKVRGSATPEAPRTANAPIIPITVPSSPIIGAITPMTER